MNITTSKEMNNSYSIQEVIERLCNVTINPKKKFDCPICGKNDATISLKKNSFNCWSGNCTDGGVRSYGFADAYLRKVEGLNDFKEIYKEMDKRLGTKLYKEFVPKEKQKMRQAFTKSYKVDKYCSEVDFDFFNDLLKEKRILLKAGTGFGKSHMLAEGVKQLLECKALEVDKVIFATPRGSIVEEIGERKYETFYKNDVELPYGKLIATTTHKAPLLVQQLDETIIELGDGSIDWTPPKDYLLIVDECHLLLTARSIVVKEHKDLRRLKELIMNAKYVVFTSANTDHFYNACKDLYDIKSYINIERKNPLYNLEKLEVKRVNADRDIRNKILIEDIAKENTNKNKVFLVHNNIKDLRHIEEELNARGILAKVIYSANKNSDEVFKDYIALIKKSILNCDVTLCTSVVDTGVNIHEKNVTTMLVQDQLNFDDVTTIQAFARVRVNSNGFNGNKGILYLTDLKNRLDKHNKLHEIDSYLTTYKNLAIELGQAFNTHMFNNYDVESYESYKDVWNLLRYNDMYAPNRQLLFLECDGDYNENPRLVVDDIATYDKARRLYLSSNYFNDKFIKDVCSEISTKEILFTKDVREQEKKEKVEGEKFQDVLGKLIDDNEFHKIIMDRYVLETNLDEEYFYIEYLKSDYATKFNKLDKRIKAFCNMIARTRIIASKFDYAIEMIMAHAMYDKKELVQAIREIEYPLYNMMYKEQNSFIGLGDSLYVSLRQAFDSSVYKRTKLSDRAIEMFTMQYLLSCEGKKYAYDEENKQMIYKKSGRPINMAKKNAESIEFIKLVYKLTDKRHLSFLYKGE